jgi:[protein-PII] uridylyltransferase
MEDAYFVAVDAEDAVSHAALSDRAAATGVECATRLDAERNATELVLATGDRLGLFADVAQALAHVGADVVGAQVFTSQDGRALDLFHLQDGAGRPFGADAPADLVRLKKAIVAAAKGAPPVRPPAAFTPTGRAAAFEITPAAAIDNEATGAATIIEVSGRDRPGLLADLSRTLADARLSIQSAHVQNFGERAVDTFYVLDETGEKLLDPERIAALRSALGRVLGRDDRAGVAGLAKPAPAR